MRTLITILFLSAFSIGIAGLMQNEQNYSALGGIEVVACELSCFKNQNEQLSNCVSDCPNFAPTCFAEQESVHAADDAIQTRAGIAPPNTGSGEGGFVGMPVSSSVLSLLYFALLYFAGVFLKTRTRKS